MHSEIYLWGVRGEGWGEGRGEGWGGGEGVGRSHIKRTGVLVGSFEKNSFLFRGLSLEMFFTRKRYQFYATTHFLWSSFLRFTALRPSKKKNVSRPDFYKKESGRAVFFFVIYYFLLHAFFTHYYPRDTLELLGQILIKRNIRY